MVVCNDFEETNRVNNTNDFPGEIVQRRKALFIVATYDGHARIVLRKTRVRSPRTHELLISLSVANYRTIEGRFLNDFSDLSESRREKRETFSRKRKFIYNIKY